MLRSWGWPCQCFSVNRTKMVKFINPHISLLYVCLIFTGWQWLDEHSTWHDYDAPVSRKIETLYSAGAGGSIDVEICGRDYQIDIDSMQQVNKDTKVTRKIQRCATGSSTEATLPTATATAPSSSSTRSTSASTSNKNKSNRKTKKGLCKLILV